MNYCQNCGETVSEKSKYCSACGSYLRRIDKFSVEETKSKFCNQCGSEIHKSYCSNCGGCAISTKLKGDTFFGAKFLNGQRREKKGNFVASERKEAKEENWKDSFRMLCSNGEDKKTTLINAGIFVGILFIIVIAVVSILNMVLVNAGMSAVQQVLEDEVELIKIEKAMDFKGLIWSVFYGISLKANVIENESNGIIMQCVLPALGLPLFIAFIAISEAIRKKITNVNGTFLMSVMQSGMYAIFAGIATLFMKVSLPEVLIFRIGYAWTDRESISAVAKGNPLVVAFVSFFIVLVTLFVISRENEEGKVWREIRKSIRIMCAVCLSITLIPGFVTAMISVVKCMPKLETPIIFVWILAMTGMYAASIFSGNVTWLNMNGRKGDGWDDSAQFLLQSGWKKFNAKVGINSNTGILTDGTATDIFSGLHMLLVAVLIIILLYFAIRLWKNVSCELQSVLVFSGVISVIGSIVVNLLQRLFCFGGELENGIYGGIFYIGSKLEILNIIKPMGAFFIIFVLGYYLWQLCEVKLSHINIFEVNKLFVLLGMELIILLSSYITISEIKVTSFQPMAKAYMTAQCLAYREGRNVDDYDYDDYDKDIDKEIDYDTRKFMEMCVNCLKDIKYYKISYFWEKKK